MKIKCLSSGLVQSNVFIVSKNGEGIVIDCGCPPELLLDYTKKQGIKIKHVILTHGHFDHIYYIDQLRQFADVKVHIHQNDLECLSDPKMSGLVLFPVQGVSTFAPADNILKDGDEIKLENLTFKIIHTPGHTKGCVCILVEGALFSGDTLFKSSVGRTDLPGGSLDELKFSIKEKLYSLPDDTVVYPGHGEATTIGFEKNHNPFCRVVV